MEAKWLLLPFQDIEIKFVYLSISAKIEVEKYEKQGEAVLENWLMVVSEILQS